MEDGKAKYKNLETILVNILGSESESGEKIPQKRPEKKPKPTSKKMVYDGCGAINNVNISSWPMRFSEIYAGFGQHVKKYWDQEGYKCPHVKFFSYMPRYDLLDQNQLKYYLFWRTLVREGEYPFVEESYLFLYIYELINSPDFANPYDCAIELAKVWKEYRGMHTFLDKYAGEWLCDYLLVHKLELPYEIVKDFFADAMNNIYAPEILLPKYGLNIPEDIIISMAKQTYLKSHYYTKETASLYDEHIQKAVINGFKDYDFENEYKSIYPAKISKDSYSGAIVSYENKFYMSYEYRPLLKSKSFSKIVASATKCAENVVRDLIGVKSKYTITDLPSQISNGISEYFRNVEGISAMNNSFELKEDYLKYYEPENKSKADINNAEEIEKNAWQTAIELGETEEIDISEEPIKESKEVVISSGENEYADFWANLPKSIVHMMVCAINGQLKSECVKNKMLIDDVERIINEVSYDTIGDSVIENGTVISDYYDDIVENMPKDV